MNTRLLLCIVAVMLLAVAAPALSKPSKLEGRWVLNEELTSQVQPDNTPRKSALDRMPRPTISVGGMPLPGTGRESPPAPAGSAADPKVLRSTELVIEPAGDTLTLRYAQGSDTLTRGNQQGLVTRWNERKLSTGYETLSRKVTATYEVRNDGRLLVTVKLNPNQGNSMIHKRVFERADPS
jgi:hypothetical protein